MTQVYFHFLYYLFDLWILVSKIKSQINTVEKIYFLYVYFLKYIYLFDCIGS